MKWFFFSSRRRHTRLTCDWSSDVCSSDLGARRWFAALLGPIPNPPPTHGEKKDAGTAVHSGCQLCANVVMRGSRGGSSGRSEERRVGKECRSGVAPVRVREYRITLSETTD